MGSQGPSRRPFCQRCSKPARLCLCHRLKSPPLDNPIPLTILQHALEKSHPLNSTRVAKLGLANLSVVPVTDVNFHARFLIYPLSPDVSNPSPAGLDRIRSERDCRPIDIQTSYTSTLPKFRVSCSATDIAITIERGVKPDMSGVLATPVGRAARSRGFVVNKLQRKQVGNTEEFVDFEEFEIVMPPGSAVLFPSEKSIGLEEVGFEVKHLVVLDGTWGKAKRMYHENPWLKLMPQLRLDAKRESLYSEVRHQPKAGCLSTIESIVCAMKALGGSVEGLDELLDVFESMIGDQRRCKDEKFSALSSSCDNLLVPLSDS